MGRYGALDIRGNEMSKTYHIGPYMIKRLTVSIASCYRVYLGGKPIATFGMLSDAKKYIANTTT